MNLVLLDPEESGCSIPRTDRRYIHITRILKKREGDTLLAACTDGRMGHARICSLNDDSIILQFEPEREAPLLYSVHLLMGFPRPIQAGRILKDLTSLGVSRIWFFVSELGEKSYAESAFFKHGAYTLALREGAEQAANPRLPEVRRFWSLSAALAALDQPADASADDSAAPDPPRNAPETLGTRIVLHPGQHSSRFSAIAPLYAPVWLAIGSERGWTKDELDALSACRFKAACLGQRILKTETAAVTAAALALQALGNI